jgi:hypothetical protein
LICSQPTPPHDVSKCLNGRNLSLNRLHRVFGCLFTLRIALSGCAIAFGLLFSSFSAKWS